MDRSESLTKYRKSLQNLRSIFQLVRQDIFDPNYKYGLSFYVILAAWMSLLMNYVYTFVWSTVASFEKAMAMTYFSATVQVFLIMDR